jgi:hypothetical protein
MANTGFIVTNNGTISDLSILFQPRGLTTKQPNTGFIASDGNDLSNWFQEYTSGDKAITTNYKLSDGITDLNLYFKKISTSTYEANGTYTTTTGTIDKIFYNTILKFSGTENSIKISGNNLNINYFIVGGGESGRSGSYNGLGYSGGIGGGAGQYIKNSFNAVAERDYKIKIGDSNTSSNIIDNIVEAITGTNGTSGNGFAPGTVFSSEDKPGPGGGGGTAAGKSTTGGIGYTFFGATYCVGGNGGMNGGGNGVAGAANTGNGGNGGNGGSSKTAPVGSGGAGGSGVVFMYFNI